MKCSYGVLLVVFNVNLAAALTVGTVPGRSFAAAPAAVVPAAPAVPSGLGGAPALGPIQQDQHYLQDTYSFLRGSSNNVGNGIEGMLSVQTSLDDLGKRLNLEYAEWMHKKQVLVGERDIMLMDVARMQAALQVQRQKEAKRQRQQTHLALLTAENKNLAVVNDEGARRQMVEVKRFRIRAEKLQAFANHDQKGIAAEIATAQKQTANISNSTATVKERAFHLNNQLYYVQQNQTEQQKQYNKTHHVILLKMKNAQETIHMHQNDLITQAQLRQQTLDFRAQIVAQANETMRQREAVISLQTNCTNRLTQADLDIRNAKISLQAANVKITECQRIDGINQQLQAQLNQCNLMKKTSGV